MPDMTRHERTARRPTAGRGIARRASRAAGWARGWRITGGAAGLVALALGGTGCSLDSLLNSDKLPSNVTDPAVTQTPDGARQAYYGTLDQFRATFGGSGTASVVAVTGLLSDELGNQGLDGNAVDRRVLVEGVLNQEPGTYNNLNRVRGQAEQGIQLLTRYLATEPALAGHLYALEGYAELFLAEFYCSGIPLSTLDYTGDYTYRAGSSTDEVLAHAAALFDTAATLAADSAPFLALAQVGRARALLGRGDYAAAAAAVATVPDGYVYTVHYAAFLGPDTTQKTPPHNFALVGTGNTYWFPLSVPDREGFTGLDWRTSGDPRSRVTGTATNNVNFPTAYHPDKYATDGSSPIVLASGVEARLIAAEAALQQRDTTTWLATLNALRTDGTFDVTATSPPDTLWHAGSGGVAGLRPLADPGTPAGRVDLLFRERGFWLFLTGHRQGDLRRLIRQYGRLETTVYPIGGYGTTGLSYGDDVTMPVPPEERQSNPLYTGCASRGA